MARIACESARTSVFPQLPCIGWAGANRVISKIVEICVVRGSPVAVVVLGSVLEADPLRKHPDARVRNFFNNVCQVREGFRVQDHEQRFPAAAYSQIVTCTTTGQGIRTSNILGPGKCTFGESGSEAMSRALEVRR